ncbi:hypothetical protein [Kitasatospora griseola]|uniref:hypothetical protein n=1 Tax=Kitasatospora griseola TaxID=2064 RepID=UPI00365DD2C7
MNRPRPISTVVPSVSTNGSLCLTGRDHLCLVVRDDRAVGRAEDRLGVVGRWVAFVGPGDPPVHLADAQDRPVRHATSRSAARSGNCSRRSCRW